MDGRFHRLIMQIIVWDVAIIQIVAFRIHLLNLFILLHGR